MTDKKDKGKKRVHILIAEDSPTQALKLEHLLLGHGYTVSVTENGSQAIEFLKGRKPDIIISDIMMPIMDGYALCRAVKADSTLREIPVILLTGLSDTGDVINGIKSGADNFLTKPYKDEFLLSRIEHVLANKEFRKSRSLEHEHEIYFAGEIHHVELDCFQVTDLLLSTFENAVQKNRELDEANQQLIAVHDELQKTNQELLQLTLELDSRVKERTVELERKSEETRVISQQLWHATKMATMGELAASIAHEMNNPLATISLRLESLLGKCPDGDPQRREMEVIEQEIDRMARLVSALLQFSRRTQKFVSTVNIEEEVEKTIDLIYYHMRKQNVKIVRDFSPDIPNIQGDRQQLIQVFLNLFTNASDAMPEGGILKISISLSQEKQVVIAISDTGSGIHPDILTRIMEPFFTTKGEGKGTGLGLSICKRIVEEHEGSIRIESSGVPGEGTTVHIVLPVSSKVNANYLKG